MKSMELSKLTDFLDTYLRIREIQDFPQALNGLQLENDGKVSRIAIAVDAVKYVMEKAIDQNADLLIVHHGLFWQSITPLTGSIYRKFKRAIQANLAIYSAHLPLDAHSEVGNNIQICKALSIPSSTPFFEEFGTAIGQRTEVRMSRNDLHKQLTAVIGGAVHCCPGGPEEVRQLGIVSGGCGSEVRRMVALGIDTLITGEGPHWSYSLAEELGLNVFYAGHYATETFGVKALAKVIEDRFSLPYEFIDHPTGL